MTPTTALKKYLTAWSKSNLKTMIRFTQLSFIAMKNKQGQSAYNNIKPISFSNTELIGINKDGVTADCTAIIDSKKVTIRLIKESEPYKPDKSGKWGVNPNSIRAI